MAKCIQRKFIEELTEAGNVSIVSVVAHEEKDGDISNTITIKGKIDLALTGLASIVERISSIAGVPISKVTATIDERAGYIRTLGIGVK